MVLAAALDEGYPVVWLALLFASAGVFHHSGIKIPFFAFFANDSGIRTKEAPPNMLLAMFLAAFVCVFLGVYPWPLYAILPFPVDYEPYTAAHVLTQSQLLFFAALAFCVLKLTGLYPSEMPGTNIDVEWFYRRLGARLARGLATLVSEALRRSERYAVRRLQAINRLVFRHHGPAGVLARTLSAGNMMLWVVALLGAYLILFLT